MPTPDPRFKPLNRFSIIIVTGGSSGIGCSFIKAILKIVPEALVCNISRSEPDVFLGEKGIHYATDLSDSAALATSARKLSERLKTAPEGEILLINNSGFGDYGMIQEMNQAKQLEMIDLNIRAVVELTGRLLPDLKQRGGVVMNIASTAAFQPTPFLATYGATKAFVMNWSLAINQDLQGTGVKAMAVCPGPTRSNFFKRAGFDTPPVGSSPGKGALDMTSEQVVDLALLGLAKNKSLVVTGFKNQCIAFFSSKFPRAWIAAIAAGILRKLRLEKHASVK